MIPKNSLLGCIPCGEGEDSTGLQNPARFTEGLRGPSEVGHAKAAHYGIELLIREGQRLGVTFVKGRVRDAAARNCHHVWGHIDTDERCAPSDSVCRQMPRAGRDLEYPSGVHIAHAVQQRREGLTSRRQVYAVVFGCVALPPLALEL